jgi:hypothetical protein
LDLPKKNSQAASAPTTPTTKVIWHERCPFWRKHSPSEEMRGEHAIHSKASLLAITEDAPSIETSQGDRQILILD